MVVSPGQKVGLTTGLLFAWALHQTRMLSSVKVEEIRKLKRVKVFNTYWPGREISKKSILNGGELYYLVFSNYTLIEFFTAEISKINLPQKSRN